MNDRQYNNPAALSAMAKGDFVNAVAAATPGGIERQEAAGQQALVSNFTQLPKDMGQDGLEVATALGFTIGADVDELFVSVKAPAGWRMSATGHSMHNKILDGEGHERGAVFYKAAFYDRRADGYWLTRYTVERHYPNEGDYNTTVTRAFDRKTGAVLFASAPATRPAGPWSDAHRRHHEAEEAAVKAATDALTATHPRHQEAPAYWGEP